MDSIKLAFGISGNISDESLQFARQLGLQYVQTHVPVFADQEKWEYDDLARMVERVEQQGLKLLAIENTPHHFYDKLLTGQPGRERQLDNYCACIENMGRAGIPTLGYHFMPNGVWRTSFSAPVRETVEFSAYDHAIAQSGYHEAGGGGDALRGRTEDDLWENYAYFINGILPAAESAGVNLALHPDDPPAREIDGIPRLFYAIEQYKKAWQLAEGHPRWGLDFCMGSISELDGSDSVKAVIDFFAPKGHIFYCHFRDVTGSMSQDGSFHETFLGDGNYDPAEMLVRLYQKGFRGHLIDDHVGRFPDDPGHKLGHAHAIGYIQGLIQMADYQLRQDKSRP